MTLQKRRVYDTAMVSQSDGYLKNGVASAVGENAYSKNGGFLAYVTSAAQTI
jgi:hypothetical protein